MPRSPPASKKLWCSAPPPKVFPNATPIALANAPTARIPSGVEVSLRGSNSYDEDGDPLTYLWTIINRPDGSVAGLSSYDSSDVRLTPDKDGVYTFKLKVTDSKSAYSESFAEIAVGGNAPVVTLNKTRVVATLGEQINLTANTNFSPENSPIEYIWSIDSKPMASQLLINNENQNSLSITPDVDGTYTFSITAKGLNQKSKATAILTIEKKWSQIIDIGINADSAVYNKNRESLFISSNTPPALKILNLANKTNSTISFSSPISSFAVSPDGNFAAIAHNRLVSYVDLKKSEVIRTIPVEVNASSIFITANNFAYLIGEPNYSSYNSYTTIIDLENGKLVQSGVWENFQGFHSGFYIEKINKIVVINNNGSYPNDLRFLKINPINNLYTYIGDSPYHGDYPLGLPIGLSEDQSIIYTSSGTSFSTVDLTYKGTLPGIENSISLSNRSDINETLVVVPKSSNYPTILLPNSVARFIGATFNQVEDLKLPSVNGQQAFALQVFHSQNGKPIILAQTTSNVYHADNAKYFIIIK